MLQQVTIKKEDHDRKMFEEDYKLFPNYPHLEKLILLEEVRELLVSQKPENDKRDNDKDFQEENKKTDLSQLIQDMNLITQRYKNMTKTGDSGFSGIIKNQGRVLPIIVGDARVKMVQNTTLIQDFQSGHNTTKDILVQEDHKPSAQYSSPVNREGRKKMIRIFPRPIYEYQKNLSSPFKSNGLPVLQNIMTNTTVLEQFHDDVTKP